MKKILIIVTISIMLVLISACSGSNNDNNKNDVQSQNKVLSPELAAEKEKFKEAGLARVTNPKDAPSFLIKDKENNDVTLQDFKGSVVFINFWASWCGPCVMEMPSIESLYQQTKDYNVKIVTINVGEKKEIVDAFMEENSYSFETYYDFEGKAAGTYGARSIPSTFIIDKDGKIIAGKLGAFKWDSERIVSILREKGM